MSSVPSIAIAPASTDELESAVRAGGAAVVDDPAAADAIVWVDPRNPDGLKDLLARSEASWVQLPFAGIEAFVAAGVIDPSRTWTCTKGVYGPACAEHVVALMLAAARMLHVHVKADSWRSGGFGSPERRLAGTTAVIVGTGGIGRALVPMLQPLGVRMIGVNRSGAPLPGAERTVPVEELDDVLPGADWLVLAAASTPETRGLIGPGRLALMKSSSHSVRWLVMVPKRMVRTSCDSTSAYEAILAKDAGPVNI